MISDDVEVFPGAVIGKEVKRAESSPQTSDKEKPVFIGQNSSIGPHNIIYNNTEIGANSVIGGHCEIGHPTPLAKGKPLIIGQRATIRSHSIFYTGSTFGSKLMTGHRVTVRERTVAGENLQIGTRSDIQGDCHIGDYVRFHSNVHIGKESKIGNYVWIFPYVVLTNDPTPPSDNLIGPVIGDYAIIATMSVILPGIVIGTYALIGAHSLVSKDVPDGMVAYGVPAKISGKASDIKLRDGSSEASYPWTGRFHRGYPPEVIKQWKISSNKEETGDTVD